MSGIFKIGNQGLKTRGPRRFGSVAAVRWLLHVVTVAEAVILGMLLDYWQYTPFATLFIFAVLISAWAGELGLGLLAVMLSIVAIVFCFLPLIVTLGEQWNAMARLTLFEVSALMFSFITVSDRSSEMPVASNAIT
jgi:K+-sensing histidine kinase KdpD